VYNKEERL